MATLVSEPKAFELRAEFPGSYKLWAEASRLKCKCLLHGGMEIADARDVITRADFAMQVDRAENKCLSSLTRLPAGDYVPGVRKLKTNSPELMASLNALVAADRRREETALASVKRTLKEWPTCKYGGTLAPVWDRMGLCTWSCTVCK